MIRTSRELGKIVQRLETAFQVRYPQFTRVAIDSRLWEILVVDLLEAHRKSRWLPIDPELFIACQTARENLLDPWSQLSPTVAIRAYCVQVRKIIRSLRAELRKELRTLARADRSGTLSKIYEHESRSVSSLAKHLYAIREELVGYAEKYRLPAYRQHLGCPLYAEAAKPLLPGSVYPFLPVVPHVASTPRSGLLVAVESIN